jgi:protein phosphatase
VIRFVPANAQHVGNRENQQDSFGFSELNDGQFAVHGGFVAIVCDGMGGLALGDQASQIAVKTFLDAYATKQPGEPIPHALDRAARSANAAVLDLAISAGTPGEVGTTLVAATYQPEGLHWISIGDSALVLLREGSLVQLNTYHTYSNILDVRAFRGEITREFALSDPQREALTSYVGARELREIDGNIRPFPVLHGDVFVHASDGLFKTLSQEQIVSTIALGPEGAASQLVSNTLSARRAHQDNVTVCTVQVIDPERAAAAGSPRTRKKLAETQELASPARRQMKLFALFFLAIALFAGAAIGGYIYYQHKVVAKGRENAPAVQRPDVAPGK